MDAGMFGWLVTFILFGGIGWLLALRWKRPVGLRIWLALLLGVFVGSRIGVNTALFAVDEFAIMLNGALMALCFGAMARLLFLRGVWRTA